MKQKKNVQYKGGQNLKVIGSRVGNYHMKGLDLH